MKKTPYLKEKKNHGTVEFPCAYYDMSEAGEELYAKHHWHEEIEVIHFQGGPYKVQIGMEQYQESQESFFFVNSGELHSIHVKSPCYETAVVFHLRMLQFGVEDLVQGTFLQPLADGKLRLPVRINEQNPAFFSMKKVYLEILRLFQSQEERSPLSQQIFMKAEILKLLGILWEGGLLLEESSHDTFRMEALKDSLSYIREHYQEKIYLKELAGKAGMNEQYFCRFFKQVIGKTPMAYLNEFRVLRSMALLRETDASVMEVCLESGFYNLGNYLREFRKVTETTPLKYRKQYREELLKNSLEETSRKSK